MSAHADPNSAAWSGKKALLSTCYRPSHCKPVEKRFLPYSWKQTEIFSFRIYQGVTELCKFSWGSYERIPFYFTLTLICRQTRKSYSSSFLGSRRLAWIMGASEQKIRRATFFSIFARPPSQFSLVRFFANPPLFSPPTNLWLLKLKQFNIYSLRRVRDVSSYSNFNRSRASKPILPRSWPPALKNINCGKQMNLFRLQIW